MVEEAASAHVRVRYLTRRAQAIGGTELEVSAQDAELDVTVRMASEKPPGEEGKAILITATAQVSPPQSVIAAMRRLADGSGLPDPISEYGSAVSLEVAVRMRRVVELARWHNNAALPNHPFEYIGADFSVDDGATWLRLPMKARAALRKPASLRFDAEAAASLASLAAAGIDEPIAHHLLREAFDVAAANPRSAIVIGVAAVEAGLKHLVQNLVPASAWLVEKMPSPPVTKMLAEFMPTLPTALSFHGVVHPPPKYARKLVANAVEERNRVVHTGGGAMEGKALRESLECFRDLLYLFDFYGGHGWALSHVSARFVHALGQG